MGLNLSTGGQLRRTQLSADLRLRSAIDSRREGWTDSRSWFSSTQVVPGIARSADRDGLALLQHEIDNDPVSRYAREKIASFNRPGPPFTRKQAHLFLVAQPLVGPRDMLLDLASGPTWNQNLQAFIEKAFTPELDAALKGTDVSPSLRDAGNGYRRARGAARATNNLGDGRIFIPFSESAPKSRWSCGFTRTAACACSPAASPANSTTTSRPPSR